MIFRLKFLIPIVCLFILGWFVKDWLSLSIMKGQLEEALPGLEVRNLDLDIESENLAIGATATYSDPQGMLASLAKLELNLERGPLGLGEVVASGNIEDVRLRKRLFMTSPEEPITGPSGNVSAQEKEEVKAFSFDSLDHREVLERFTGERKLETEKRIEEAGLLIKKLEKKWLPRQKALKFEIESFRQDRGAWAKNWATNLSVEPLLLEAKTLEKEAKALKDMKFDGRDIAQLTSNLQKIQGFQVRLTGLQKNFENVRTMAKAEISKLGPLGLTLGDPTKLSKELEADLKQLSSLRQSLSSSTQDDIAMLKKELNPSNFNSSKTIRLIMGRDWEMKFKSSLEILDNTLGPLLPTSFHKEDSPEADPSEVLEVSAKPNLTPLKIHFPREVLRPTWNISSLRYAGYADQAFENADIRFEGILHDLSSDESILGRPPRMSLTAFLPGQGGLLNLDLRYSITDSTPDQRVMKVHLKDRPLDGTSMGAPSSRLLFESGSWGLDGVIDLSSAPQWAMRGKIFWVNPVFDVDPSVKEKMRAPLRSVATRLLSQPISFIYRYPSGLSFEGDFKKWVGPIFNDALLAVAGQEQKALTQKLLSRLNPKMENVFQESQLQSLLSSSMPLLLKGALGEKAAFKELNTLAGSQLNSLGEQDALLGQLLSDVLGLQGKGAGAKGQLEERLKDEAKRRLQDLATRKLGEKLLGGQSDEKSPSPTEEEKRSSKDVLKDELKKELKDAFRGFPF